MKRLVEILALAGLIAGSTAMMKAAQPLQLITKYQMPAGISGRFDHLGVDPQNRRLFVTAETAHEVLVFNLRDGKFIRAIAPIGIPHAVLFRADLDRIYVTDGGEGAVRVYDGKTYKQISSVKLKVDADSIGYDPETHYLYVVNGGGDAHESFSMLSVVDTSSDKKVADIKLAGDTLEQMALSNSGPKLYIEDPAKNQVDVVNRRTRTLITSWPVTMGKKNVSVALDGADHRLFVACRSGVIVVFDTSTGKELKTLQIPQGVDDLTYESASKRIYASCGAGGGSIAVYRVDSPNHFTSLGRIPSGPGGKNEILVPELKRLFVTVPPHGSSRGEVYAYKVAL